MGGGGNLFWKKIFRPLALPHLSKNTEKERNMFKHAQWIWCSARPQSDEYGEFYKSFHFSGERMILNISADSNYAVYVNGKLSAFGQYPDYPHYKIYDEIDITADCQKGENHLAIIVWYYGDIKSSTYFEGKAALMFELFEDGESVAHSSENTPSRISNTYKSHALKKITVQLGLSFAYDATAEDGWMQGKLEDFYYSHVVWQKLPLFKRPCKRLYLDPMVEAKQIADGLFELPQNTVGFIYIETEADAAKELVISYAEHLNEDGGVNRFIDKRDFSVRIKVKAGETVYMNPFRRLGAKYLEVTGGATVKKIGIVPVMYPVNTLPRPELSEEDARIYDICERTLRMCMHEHYEDCPWREQGLYSMDSRNQMLCGYYLFGEYEYPRANLELIANDSREDGLLSICFPMPEGLAIPSYSLYYFISCAEYLKYSGDAEFIKKIYPRLRHLLEVCLSHRREDGLIYPIDSPKYWNFYEWRDGLAVMKGDEVNTPDLIFNALLSIALSNMAYMSDRIGVQNGYAQMARELNARIRESFYDAELHLFRHRCGSDILSAFGNSLAVLCGAVEGEDARAVCEAMLENKDVIPPSLSMQCFFYDALLTVDREKYRDYILEDIRRVYRPMVETGVGTVWETELGWHDFADAGSLCHGWSAMPVYYYNVLK